MLYKEDWNRAGARLSAWLAGENVGGPIVQVIAPREGVAELPSFDPWLLARSLGQADGVVRAFEDHCADMWFGGDAYPNLTVNLGPGTPAAFLGCVLHVRDDTIWFEPEADYSLEEIAAKELDDENEWWQLTRRLTDRLAELGKDKFIANMPDLNSDFDILGHLRGRERLLTDLIDKPREVERALGRIHEVWFECYEELAAITGRYAPGTSTWMQVWSPGRGSDVQCDFSALISPAMFEEFELPILEDSCRRLDHSYYHLDGPDAMRHVEMILGIEELDAVQWVPGAGNPGVGSPTWFPLYEKIQSAGKRLILSGFGDPGLDLDTIERVLEAVDPQACLIQTSCTTEREARDLLECVEHRSTTGSPGPRSESGQ